MIQRIQTIYLLLIAAIAWLLLLTDPSFVEFQGFAKWTGGEKGIVSVHFNKVFFIAGEVIKNESSLVLTSITLGIIGAIALLSIFFYKFRKLQIIISASNYIFIIGLYILMINSGFKYHKELSQEASFDIAIGLFFPLFLPLFNFMALRRINFDETLIRSVNRIR